MPARRSLSILSLAAAPVLTIAMPAQGHPRLHAPMEFPPTMVGYFELLGDLDLDLDVDAISFHSPTGNAIKASFTVWLNDGTGAFTAGATTNLPAQSGHRVLLADVDGDGRGDLIVSTTTAGPLGAGLLLFAGQPGGAFAPFVHHPLSGNVLSLAAGKGNADTITDLLVWHSAPLPSPSVTRWLLGAPGLALVQGPTSAMTSSLERVVVDANGDGLDDIGIAQTGLTPGLLTFHLTTATGFQPGPTVPLLPVNASHVVAADHDGDGDRDVLVIASHTGGLIIDTITNHGGGNWSPAGQQLENVSGGHPWIGDWDGDGKEDLIVRGGTSGAGLPRTCAFLRSTGAGFETGYWLRIGGEALGSGAGLADLNQDGDLDFLDSRSAWLGDGSFVDPFGDTDAHSLLDWDGDGDEDILVPDVSVHDGNRSFTPQQLAFPPLPPNHVYGDGQLLTDFDRDGRHEILVGVFEIVFFQYVLRETHLLRETTDFTFTFVRVATAPGTLLDAGVVDDTDGDGDLDVISRTTLWLNDGTDFFTPSGTITTGYGVIAKGDVDGDNDQDLLATTLGAGTSLAVLHRTAPNTYSTTVLFPANGNTVLFVTATRFFDVDDDGDLDVVARDRQPNGIWRALVFTNQNGVFTQAAVLPHPGTALAGDVDGDGLTDLAFWEAFRLVVLRRTGPGPTYAPPATFTTPHASVLVDVDQDGDADVVGSGIVQNRAFHGPSAGHRRQYGNGSLGAGGWRPILSMRGPIREGLTPTMSLRRAPGGTFALLILGSGAINTPSIVLPGVQSYVAPIDALIGFTLNGALGQPGAGSIDLPLAIPIGLGGVHAFVEFVVFDPTVPGSFTHSNGCELAIGQ